MCVREFMSTIKQFVLSVLCSYFSLLFVIVMVIFTGVGVSESVEAGTVYYEKSPVSGTKSEVKPPAPSDHDYGMKHSQERAHQQNLYQLNKAPLGQSEYQQAELLRLQNDYKRAEQSYTRAAELGYGPAHFRLGQMYATGRGSVRSLVEAHMHYNLGSYLGVDDARTAMLILEDQMSEDQVERAMRRAVRYRQQHNL